ncbi:MAG: hypothetical protein DWQ31_00680 [Planctomycetota bacterium]|nr:MAG: hypothetical protein DWQ31_00680 [Planctomycetota bacterium]REJ86704.1 MAG: hypothetical protein DWQ35_23020 [Planctomycetota bacterium]REK27124.1 MAG: hypothetical protein DWQ42_07400 [Planctomycetota bacterium]REK37879.1 MAG: hypothetical protein DWQ46_21710 [Planctomycetota bacterium]
MKNLVLQLWKEDEGVLTFEWILLLTLLTIGIVSGLSTVRDAIISELGDVAQAMLSLDQSYTIAPPLVSSVHTADGTTASDSSFSDAIAFTHCNRANFNGMGPVVDCNGNFPLLNAQPTP